MVLKALVVVVVLTTIRERLAADADRNRILLEGKECVTEADMSRFPTIPQLFRNGLAVAAIRAVLAVVHDIIPREMRGIVAVLRGLWRVMSDE
jgi:hypothetical protein